MLSNPFIEMLITCSVKNLTKRLKLNCTNDGVNGERIIQGKNQIFHLARKESIPFSNSKGRKPLRIIRLNFLVRFKAFSSHSSEAYLPFCYVCVSMLSYAIAINVR